MGWTMPIYGETVVHMDARGKLTIPLEFRPFLEGGGALTRSFNAVSLTFYPAVLFTEMQARLDERTDDPALLARLARMWTCLIEIPPTVDGDLCVPPHLRHHARLDDAVVILALGDRLEFWNAQRWQQYDSATP